MASNNRKRHILDNRVIRPAVIYSDSDSSEEIFPTKKNKKNLETNLHGKLSTSVLQASASKVSDSVVTQPSKPDMGADVDMVQAGDETLIAPRRLPNPCLDNPQRMDLHRELMFNQKIGKNVLNQKSELEKALLKHKEKQILNQVNQHKETPELERAITERAKRLEQAEQPSEGDGTNPTLAEVRARLRHAAPAPSAPPPH